MHAPTLRKGWVVVTVLAALLAVFNVVGVGFLLLNAEWLGAVLGLLTIVGLYWFAAGVWLRTPWGSRGDTSPPPDAPELTEGRAHLYGVVGGLCVVACLLALALQAIAGDWVDDPEPATASEVARQLSEHVQFSDLSDGVERYYAELYFDGDHMMVGSFDEGQVLLVDRAGGFDSSDMDEIEAALVGSPYGPTGTAIVHEGVAVVVVVADPGALEKVRSWLDD